MVAAGGLKLRAEDAEDLRVLATVLQDALVPLGDIVFQKRQRRLVMVANRFLWEDQTEPEALDKTEVSAPPPLPEPEGDAAFDDDAPPPRFRRVNCGVRFDSVQNVQIRGIDLKHRDQILNLLTFDVGPEALILVFSDGAAIRLVGRNIHCQLEDLGEPWPTDWRPSHRLDESDRSD